ncbi:MAG: PadR family transcriptional regulator [Halanaeroarchaeum sp.]
MGKWLRSGLRRDICYEVDARDRPTGQSIKRGVEAQYDERIPPRRFHGALDALVDTGHLAAEPDGVHDRYWLTAAGANALEAHRAWVCEDRQDS